MSTSQGDSSTDSSALRALFTAVIGVALGVFAFKLHLRGGDDKFLTYGLGVACSGFYIESLRNLAKALRAKTSPQAGAPRTSQVLVTAFTITAVGVCMFTLSSILAVYLDTFKDKSGIEVFVGLTTAAIAFAGPLLLGGVYWYWMQQSLCESGLNIAAALLIASGSAAGSVFFWYFLNIKFGPQLYKLLL